MGRIFAGLIVGVIAAMAIILAIDWAGHHFYPIASDVALDDPETMLADYVAALPVGAKLTSVFAWFAGALGGGYLALRITRRRWAAWAVAAVVAAAGIANVLLLPHPVWMQIAAVVAPSLGAVIANHIPSRVTVES
jgi:hypothetical protein